MKLQHAERIGPGPYFDLAFTRGHAKAASVPIEVRKGHSVDLLACMYAYAMLVGMVPLAYDEDWPVAVWRHRAINDFGTFGDLL